MSTFDPAARSKHNPSGYIDRETGQPEMMRGSEFAAKQTHYPQQNEGNFGRRTQSLVSRGSVASNRSNSKIGMGSRFATMKAGSDIDGLSRISKQDADDRMTEGDFLISPKGAAHERRSTSNASAREGYNYFNGERIGEHHQQQRNQVYNQY